MSLNCTVSVPYAGSVPGLQYQTPGHQAKVGAFGLFLYVCHVRGYFTIVAKLKVKLRNFQDCLILCDMGLVYLMNLASFLVQKVPLFFHSFRRWCHNCYHVCRRDLLRLIGVREFSLEANFQDPCRSFILPEVGLVTWLSCDPMSLVAIGDLRVLQQLPWPRPLSRPLYHSRRIIQQVRVPFPIPFLHIPIHSSSLF